MNATTAQEQKVQTPEELKQAQRDLSQTMETMREAHQHKRIEKKRLE